MSSEFSRSPRKGNFANQAKSIDPAIAHLRVPPHSVEAEQSVLGGLLLGFGVFGVRAALPMALVSVPLALAASLLALNAQAGGPPLFVVPLGNKAWLASLCCALPVLPAISPAAG